MKKICSLLPPQLSLKTDAREFKFKTTADIQENVPFIGQSRAVEAIQFSIGIKKDGYNLYAMGSPGVGKRTVILNVLQEEAAKQSKIPSDWCYLYNFEHPQKPIAAQLPAGLANELQHDMKMWVAKHYQQKNIGEDSEHGLTQLERKYQKYKPIVRYLDAVQKDVSTHSDACWQKNKTDVDFLTRYQVNVLVDNKALNSAPVIYEENPTYANLLGRVAYITHQGVLSTHFNLIKAGTLHKANGGYLIVDAAKLLQDKAAWQALKQALFTGKIRIGSAEPATGAFSTLSIEPKPIPLNVKIILLGDRYLHYTLCDTDPDFNDLFKVTADFDEDIPRTKDNARCYAQFIAALAKHNKLLPFDRKAVALIIDYAARLAEDAEKLSVHMRSIHDLLHEADYWATQTQETVVQVTHIQQAIDAKIYRLDRMRDAMYEDIQRKITLIDLKGKQLGQINGLVVVQLGNFNFGYPCRITAQAHVGEGEIIDIQRETEMSGTIHTKGVLILSGFLAGRYIKNTVFSLSASVVFEQTYSEIDGDSASVAELCALISTIAEVPLKQALAVTGSVNQHGEVQVVGGINEKIEGFFDVCKANGLTGEQGVIIPAGNIENLMLKNEVIKAVAQKKFHIYAVTNVDQVIELLSDMPAGARGKNGKFPKGSLNEKVESRLSLFAKVQDGTHKKKGK